MTTTPAAAKAQLLDKLLLTLRERLPVPPAGVQDFAGQYYALVAPEDLLDDELEDLYGALLAHWHFARQRPASVALVRVCNPNDEEYGWQSTHTAVEIVTEDMPFLVDSVTMALNRHGLTVHRIIHPVMGIVRDSEGVITAVQPAAAGGAEAIMRFEVDRRTDSAVLQTLTTAIRGVLADVRVVVEDWPAMRGRLLELIDSLDIAAVPIAAGELDESRAFLRWLAGNNFTFLGFRHYALLEEDGEFSLRAVAGSGLGILRDDQSDRISRSFAVLPPAQQALVHAPELLILTKASARSTVHRPARLDYVGVKRFDAAGKVCGEWRWLGLYTALAYSMRPGDIPLLRRKIHSVLARARLEPHGYSGKVFQHILDTFPRDVLFQISEDTLYEVAMGILLLQERQRLRLFVIPDRFGRFVSCLVYVPRDRYDSALRRRMQAILLEALHGESAEFTTQVTESILAQVLFTIRMAPGWIPDITAAELEARLREAMISWTDRLRQELLAQCGEEAGNGLFERYGEVFPAAYRDDFTPRTAVSDIQRLEELTGQQPLQMRLYRLLEDPTGSLRFKLFGPDQPIALSAVLPTLEHLGLRVLKARPYELATQDGGRLWVLDFDLAGDHGLPADEIPVRDIFQEAFARVWRGEMENDGFNRLVLGAGLAWRDVVMLRAYCKYLLQIGAPFSQAYMERALAGNAGIARLLAELFHARFDPRRPEDQGPQATALSGQIEAALEAVTSLDEDRILRRFLNLIQATTRVNFFQTDRQGQPKDYLAIKLAPGQISELPAPRPRFEIFVYSPRVEAVHLRGGPVARGGLRWSDRREDFRTEVLGLLKAQMVKNAVIVPVGAKGGFVVKRPPADRESLQQEGIAGYTTLIRGLLDLTDNRIGGAIVAPPQVVRYDPDDPYLVVAADKGTATFSDIANAIAGKYGFWLGDAFASGGATGYDHKKMGITARGAWESVKRHFRELGLDIQNRDDFTVVGIGDMSGDVFGNAMLLSRHIRLIAAFNHQHVFLDPDPDPELSYRERERLFRLPRSTWADYDPDRLSPGGGVYPLAAKAIPLSLPVRRALAIKAERLTPSELISHLLRAPVDLLWNGGIGTYVKASTESHAGVGDRTNDAVRVNGSELRCRVVGEGGNLGFTQRGRIEYARCGGRILTDAIDNSAGVNCSDHEVNIKILLDQAVASGDLTGKQRNRLLADMTDEVAERVLRQNHLQPQAISVAQAQAPTRLSDDARLLRALEKAGRLNRALEGLPDDEELARRENAREGLTPPELAVLLACGKITLKAELLASDVLEDPCLQQELLAYFPKPLGETFAGLMSTHPLRREIIATHLTNSLVNRLGSGFAFRLQEETGAGYPDIVRAWVATREIFQARRVWGAIEALNHQAAAAVQIQMLIAVNRLLERASRWLLRHRRPPLAIEATVARFRPGVTELNAELPKLLAAVESDVMRQTHQELSAGGVPEELVRWVASSGVLYSALDLVEIAAQCDRPVADAAAVYFDLAQQLELTWLGQSIGRLVTANHWQERARNALLNSLYDQARALTADVLQNPAPGDLPAECLAAWLAGNRRGVERVRGIFTDLRAAGQPDLAMLSVALREIGYLTGGRRD